MSLSLQPHSEAYPFFFPWVFYRLISAHLFRTWLSAQAVNIIFIYSTNALHGEARYYDGKHRLHPPIPSPLPANINKYYDYTNAMYMLAGVTGFATLAFMFFKTEYKRLKVRLWRAPCCVAVEPLIPLYADVVVFLSSDI